MLSDIVQGCALSHVKSNQKKPEYHDKTEDTEYSVDVNMFPPYTEARYTTKLKDIQFSNKIECDHKKGFCTVTPGIPESCGGNVNTLYHDIIDYVSDDKKKWINREALSDYTNMKGNEEGDKDCKEGYRKSVTWEYEEVKFQPNDVNNDKGLLTKVFKKNCSFCEKVLFTSSKVCSGGVDDSNCNGLNSTKDEGKVIGSIKKDEKGNIKSITESEIIKLPAHDIMASYYLGTLKHNKEKNRLEFKGPDTLQLGSGDVWVFRVIPGMTLTDYENLEPPSNYVDPFKPFNDESGGVIVKKSSGESETHKMLSDKLLSDAKRGVFNDDDFKETIQNFYECKSRDKGLGLCSNYSKPGLCPVGMIATKKDNGTIACHTYISNPHRAGCYTPKVENSINQDSNINSIASGSGNAGNEASRQTAAKSRLGCLNGFRLEIKDKKGLLQCEKATNIAGTSIKHCRARGQNKYDIVPVFKNDKLSFECQINRDSKYYGRSCIDVTSDNVVGFSVESCKMNSVTVAPSLLSISKDSSTGVALKNLKDDNVSKVCKRHNIINEVVDELGRRLNIERMTSMFLVNDCFTCL